MLIAAVLLAGPAAAAALLRGAGSARAAGCREDPNAHIVPANMADSEIVEGPDCGNVKKIVNKFAKSTKVGKLSGEATNAITGAERAAAEAEDAKEATEKA